MIALLFKPHLDEQRIKSEFDAILQEQLAARAEAGLDDETDLANEDSNTMGHMDFYKLAVTMGFEVKCVPPMPQGSSELSQFEEIKLVIERNLDNARLRLGQLRKSDVTWFKVKMRIEHIEKLLAISEKELLLNEDEWAHDSPTTTALWYAYVTLACQLSRIRKNEPSLFEASRPPPPAQKGRWPQSVEAGPNTNEHERPETDGEGQPAQSESVARYNEEVERSMRGSPA